MGGEHRAQLIKRPLRVTGQPENGEHEQAIPIGRFTDQEGGGASYARERAIERVERGCVTGSTSGRLVIPGAHPGRVPRQRDGPVTRRTRATGVLLRWRRRA